MFLGSFMAQTCFVKTNTFFFFLRQFNLMKTHRSLLNPFCALIYTNVHPGSLRGMRLKVWQGLKIRLSPTHILTVIQEASSIHFVQCWERNISFRSWKWMSFDCKCFFQSQSNNVLNRNIFCLVLVILDTTIEPGLCEDVGTSVNLLSLPG